MAVERLIDQGHSLQFYQIVKFLQPWPTSWKVAIILENPNERDVSAIRRIPCAEKLTIQNAAISSGMQSAIGRLDSLQTIVIENCTLADEGLTFFTSLPGVREIEIRECTFDGHALNQLRHPERLTEITMIDCQLIDGRLRIPSKASQLTHIEIIDTRISIDSFQQIIAHPAVVVARFDGDKGIDDSYFNDAKFGPSLEELGLRGSSVSDAKWKRLNATLKQVWVDL